MSFVTKMQSCVHGSFAKTFNGWGYVVARWPCLVLVINLIILLFMSRAALNPIKVEDERTVWTPVGN
jgi:hypothetical protein